MTLQRILTTSSIFRGAACHAALTAFLSVAFLHSPATCSAGGITLGQAANYAVLGIGEPTAISPGAPAQFEIYQSATVVNGNVGVGPNSQWSHGMDATINGRVDEDPSVSPPTVTGTITGGIHSTPMAGVVADALAGDTAAAALTPTQIFTTLSENQVITGGPGLNVIRITGDVTLKKGLTISGTSTSQFVFQLTANDATSAKTLTLSGMTMTLSGGVTAGNILWDMHGLGGQIAISSSAVVDGTFLAPDRSILVDNATVIGAVIGGGGPEPKNSNSLSIHSSSTINFDPFVSAVPEPSTLVIAASGALCFLGYGLLRRWRSK